jgi:hypothetical protein
MRGRAKIAVAIAAVAVATTAEQAHASTTCTWAGTHLAPTGVFWISPGVTNTPSSGPLKFLATGVLGGGASCHGTVRFAGQMDAGATCAFATFRGRVTGLRGVRRFLGRGGGVDVPSQLFDRKGRVVGVENADIMTQSNFPHTTDCATPQGFRGGWPGMFSSVITRFGRGG